MGVTRIVANLRAEDPADLARFYENAFGFDLPHDMVWIRFSAATRRSKLSCTLLLKGDRTSNFGVTDLQTTEAAVRAAGGELSMAPQQKNGGSAASFSAIQPGLVNVVNS